MTKTASRAPSWRVWLPLVVLAVISVVLQTTEISRHRGFDNVVAFGSMVIGFLLMVGWFCLYSAFPKALRLGTLIAIFVTVLVTIVQFEIVGFTGDMWPIIRNRFQPKPDWQLASDETPKAFEVDLQTTTKDDFWQFLGPKRDLVIEGVALKTDLSKFPPKLLWKQPIGRGWSAFSVVNGFAITMEQRGDSELVTCYDIRDGKLCWTFGHKVRYEHLLAGVGPRATPTIHNGKVYTIGATGWLVCLDGATGKVIWEHNLLEKFNKPEAEEAGDLPFGRAGSPLIVNDLVVAPVGGPKGKRVSLAAFNKETGELVWQAGTRHIGYSSPTLVTLAGKEQILNVTEGHVLGHDPETGKVLWEYEWEGHSNTDATSSQAVAVGPNRVFVSRGYGGGGALFEIVPNNDGSFTVRELYHNRGVLRTKFANVAVRDGHIYGLSDGVLECVKLDTGKRVWKGGRYGHGQILLVGDILMVLGENGELLLIEATPERTNNVLGQWQALEGLTWNNIALYGNKLLIRNGEQAACYELALE